MRNSKFRQILTINSESLWQCLSILSLSSIHLFQPRNISESPYSMKKYAKALPNNLKNNRQILSKLGISREINEFFPSIFNNNFNGRLEKSK